MDHKYLYPINMSPQGILHLLFQMPQHLLEVRIYLFLTILSLRLLLQVLTLSLYITPTSLTAVFNSSNQTTITTTTNVLSLYSYAHTIAANPSTTPSALIYAFQVSTGTFTENLVCTCFNIENSSLSYILKHNFSFIPLIHLNFRFILAIYQYRFIIS